VSEAEDLEIVALPVHVETREWKTKDGGIFQGDIVDARCRVVCGIHTMTGCTEKAHRNECERKTRTLNAVAELINGNAKR